jgi:hypothetical protein
MDRISKKLEASQKPSQETFEFAIYILGYLSCTRETEILANQLQLNLKSKLTPEEIEATQKRAGSKSLDEFVRQILIDI